MLAGATALATVAAVIALAVTAGSPGAPTIAKAATLATRAATAPLPARDAANPTLTRAHSVRRDLPGLEGQVGWRAGGAPLADGRAARTVFYRHTHHRIGFTVISGEPLKRPAARSGSSSMASRCTAIATGAAPSSRSCATAIRVYWPAMCTSPHPAEALVLGWRGRRSGF